MVTVTVTVTVYFETLCEKNQPNVYPFPKQQYVGLDASEMGLYIVETCTVVRPIREPLSILHRVFGRIEPKSKSQAKPW